MIATLVAGITLALPAALGLAVDATTPPAAVAHPFVSLADVDAEIVRVTAGTTDADLFWRRVCASGDLPLVFDRTAVFFWRGTAARVEWRGDLVGWEESEETRGRRIGSTDLWTWRHELLPASRADYKIVLDGSTWLLDPRNPHQQVGGYGPNSEIRMPGWHPAAHAERREGVAAGRLVDLPIASARLGYRVDVRVYTPAGFDPASGARLPVLYVTDGSDYWREEIGALPVTLDNLIAAQRLPPLLAVFVDPWDRAAGVNRRERELVPAPDGTCPFCDFLVEELVPAIDRSYPTLATREHRAILGTSLGGLHATFLVTAHGDTFGLAGIQSPALRHLPGALDRVRTAPQPPLRAVVDCGLYEGGMLEDSRILTRELAARGTQVKSIEVPEGHSWGHWRQTAAELLEFLFARPPR